MSNIFVELSNGMADVAEQTGKSIVSVNARRRLPASGVVFAKDLVLTANHVMEREEDITVTFADGTTLSAKLAGRDAGTDLAVLKLEKPVKDIAQASKSAARVGQIVLALARPSSEGIEASLGTVSAISGPIRTGGGGMLDQYIRTDSISYPGFSGGALVAADGGVLGINTSGLARGMAITIPANIAWAIGDTLAKHGHIKRGYLGVRSQPVDVSADAQKELKRVQEMGLLIIGVEDDSPATKGGMIVGDILVGVAGVAIVHHDELFTRLSGDVVGKSTPIEILRGGKPQILNIVIGER